MAGMGGLSQGFLQGFQTFGNYFDRQNQRAEQQEHRQWQRDRAETQDAQRAELHDYKVGEFERQEQLRDRTAMLHQARNADGPMEIDFTENKWAQDPVFNRMREDLKIDPSKVVGENREAAEQAVQWFEQLTSDDRRPAEVMNDERTLGSAQVLLGELVNENLGETFERDGKTFTIRDKRIASVVPDPTGEGVNIGLKVRAVGPDGEETDYDAPMTEGHSANDDLVLNVSMEKIVQRVQGHKALLQGTANMSPEEVRAALEPEILRLGGELPKNENFEMLRDQQGNPVAQMGPDGRMHDLPQSMRPGGGDDADWRRLNDGSLFNQRTGEVRQAGPGGGGAGTPGSEAPSSVWAQMRADYTNRYGIDADQMMVLLQTEGEEGINRYMEERAGPNVPNLMEFARNEYGVDPATGTFIRDMRQQQGQGMQAPQGGQGFSPQAGGQPRAPQGAGLEGLLNQQSPLETAHAAQYRGPQKQAPQGRPAPQQMPQGGPAPMEPAAFGEAQSSGMPGSVPVPPWANAENAIEMSGGGRGISGGARLNRDVERAAPYFEARAEGREPSPGALGMAVRAARQGLLSPEAEADVREMARRYAQQQESQQR